MKKILTESDLLHVTTREQWREWLAEHYQTEKEIWLVSFRKHTGKPNIEYNDGVEEALCFGWIDSTIKTIDEDRNAQRYSPRNPKSPYSQPNKERLRVLVKQGRVIPEVLESVRDMLEEPFVMPPDILDAVKANEQAWNHFQSFPDVYKRIRIAFIDRARICPEEFEKRLRYFLKKTEQNKMYGFSGIEKYYT